jgi:hypothetical protein
VTAVLRGIVQSAYAVAGRDVYVTIEMLSGPANAGTSIDLPLRSGTSRVVEVAGVELVRHEGAKATVALRIIGVRPDDVLVGALVREIDSAS